MSGADAAWLHMDRPTNLMVINSVLWFDRPIAIDDLREFPLRHPDIDVALFHLGGTRVLVVLVTMDADQGVEAMRMVDPRQVVPVHHEDYDVFTSSLDDFLEAATAAGLSDRVVVVDRGREHLMTPPEDGTAGGVGSPGAG